MRRKFTWTAPLAGIAVIIALTACSPTATSGDATGGTSTQTTGEACAGAGTALASVGEKTTAMNDAVRAWTTALADGGDAASAQQAAAEAIGAVRDEYSGAAEGVENTDVKSALETMAQALDDQLSATTTAQQQTASAAFKDAADKFVALCS